MTFSINKIPDSKNVGEEAAFKDAAYDVLVQMECENGRVNTTLYLDSEKIPTIGVGYNLSEEYVIKAIIRAMIAVSDNDKKEKEEAAKKEGADNKDGIPPTEQGDTEDKPKQAAEDNKNPDAQPSPTPPTKSENNENDGSPKNDKDKKTEEPPAPLTLADEKRIAAYSSELADDFSRAKGTTESQANANARTRWNEIRKAINSELYPEVAKGGKVELSETVIKEAFREIMQQRLDELDKEIDSPKLEGNNYSYERLAALSLKYGSPADEKKTLIGNNVKAALHDEDRFKMWFEIRYNSNGNDKKDRGGTAKRRYYESELFGVTDKRGEITEAEAKHIQAHY